MFFCFFLRGGGGGGLTSWTLRGSVLLLECKLHVQFRWFTIGLFNKNTINVKFLYKLLKNPCYLQPLRNNPWLTSLLKRHLILVLTGLLIIMFRLWMMGSTEPRFVEYDNPHSYQNGTLLRVSL